ncbi:alpha/beta fold hydrolase [Aerococcaceae bacterium zg-252]
MISQNRISNYDIYYFRVNLLNNEDVIVQLTMPIFKDLTASIPLVLCQHSHGGNYTLGKREIIESNHYLQPKSYAEELSKLGCATISIDARGFGTRHQFTESELVKEALLYGQTLWGLMLYDLQYLLDFIQVMDLINPSQIGALGMSMGGLMSWWLAAIDERIEWVVDIGSQLHLETLVEQKKLNKHGHYYYVPRLLRYFTTEQIQAKIVPRARLTLVGNQDGNCPIEGVHFLHQYLERIYANEQAIQNWDTFIDAGGHEETPGMRKKWIEFVKHQIGNNKT